MHNERPYTVLKRLKTEAKTDQHHTIAQIESAPKKQKGQRIETDTAFFLRYYVTTSGGKRKQECIMLARKSDLYRSWKDLEPLIEQELSRVNEGVVAPTGRMTLGEYWERIYLPHCINYPLAAPTISGYQQNWNSKVKAAFSNVSLANLTTKQVSDLLTHYAKAGLGREALSRIKFLLSGMHTYAISQDLVSANPVTGAAPDCRVKKCPKPAVYTMEQAVRFVGRAAGKEGAGDVAMRHSGLVLEIVTSPLF